MDGVRGRSHDGRGGWSICGSAGRHASAHRRGAPLGGDRTDFSPRESPGRIAAAWVHTSLLRGLLVMSVYFWTGE